MIKLIFKSTGLLFLLLSFSVFAQDELEEFKPLPKNIKQLKAIQHSIYEGDTIAENYFEYNFDKKGNIISWKYPNYYVMEEIEYDSIDRITKIDGLYGESFSNGIITYYYPSKNQKIEIHDKMGFHKYIKSDFIFDKLNKIVAENQYDSTFNLIDSTLTIKKIHKKYTYDKHGNLIEEIHFIDSTNEVIYEMHALYNENKLLTKTEHYSDNYTFYQTHTSEEISYVKEGEFKDKIAKTKILFLSENDTTKTEISYTYKKLDSNIVSQERKYFTNDKFTQHSYFYYKNNELYKLEEYAIEKEQTSQPKLEMWTEYTYLFYPKTKE